MKFIVMHKHDKKTEAGIKPPPELVQKVGAFVGSMAQSGKLLDGEGLGATKTRSRVSLKGGHATVTHGPYAPGTHELPANFAKVKVASRDEAIRLAVAMGKAMGDDAELEVGKLTEEWDLGFGEKPVGAPERYLLIHKATAETEAGKTLDIEAATREAKSSGALVGSMALTPSAKGKRMSWKRGEYALIDGPFAETKELIGGYVAFEMASLDECIAVCDRYSEIMLTVTDELEFDIRPLA